MRIEHIPVYADMIRIKCTYNINNVLHAKLSTVQYRYPELYRYLRSTVGQVRYLSYIYQSTVR
jgi:hypothetical protein